MTTRSSRPAGRRREFTDSPGSGLLSPGESLLGGIQGASGRQAEVNLGHICNDICSFCVSGQLTQERIARPVPVGPVLESMEKARAQGASQITFLGGEPTIQANFMEALQAAFQLGFEEIVVFTNMARGMDRRFLERAAAVGRFEWRISVQGGDAETHDKVVGRKGAYDRIRAGMDWLADSDRR